MQRFFAVDPLSRTLFRWCGHDRSFHPGVACA